MGNYWLHRISNCWSVAKPLFDDGILTIGWQSLCQEGVIEATEDWEKFRQYTMEHNENSRSKWALYRFAHMEAGDTVVVPLYDKDFAIVEVEEGIKKISELPEEYLAKLSNIYLKNGFIYHESNDEPIDIGFFCRVSLPNCKPREHAEARLRSRMKIRQTNSDIGDIAELVERAKESKEVPKPFNKMIEEIKADLIKKLQEDVDPDRFEDFICRLMEKLGASSTEVLAKNEPGKQNGADADVVADFDKLGMKIYIQAKRHTGITDGWSVTQISEYCEQKKNSETGRKLYWVISTGDGFDNGAVENAMKKNIRLIDGNELAEIVLSVGINDLKDFF